MLPRCSLSSVRTCGDILLCCADGCFQLMFSEGFKHPSSILHTIPDVLFIAQGDVTIFNIYPPVVLNTRTEMDG